MKTARVEVVPIFRPLWERRARHKGAHGGRGSGKSHDRASASVRAMMEHKRVVGLREVQGTLRDSVYQLVSDKITEMGVRSEFRIMRDEIRHVYGPGKMIFQGMKDHSAKSIKSLEGYDVAWVEEASAISQRSIELLIPTIRKPGSEIWWIWNPEYDHDPVDQLLRGPAPPEDAIVVEANYWDNPFFPDSLRSDMERDQRLDTELYEHIWCGAYRKVGANAFYGKQLSAARLDGRICSLPIESGPQIYTAWDIGIVVTAIWAAQRVGHEMRIIDYYEDTGYEAAHYAKWVIERGYDSGEALLPHDADIRGRGTAKSYRQHLIEAGLTRTRVLERTNDVLGDIQRVRTFLPRCWFDKERCRDGLKALGSYHSEWDESLVTPRRRPVGDWSSHGADAFRYLALGILDVPTDNYWDPSISPNYPSERTNFERRRKAATTGYTRS